METTVEQLIKERSYASLTSEELQSVSELCETEEEFQHMKQFFLELESVTASEKTIINPEVKQSLDSIFSAKFPGIHANWTAPETVAAPAAPVIPLHQRTWVRVAAVGLIVLATAPFWNMVKTNEASEEKAVQMAKLETPQANETQQPDTESSTLTSDPSVEKKSETPQFAEFYDGDYAADEAGASDKEISVSAETMTAGAAAPVSSGTHATYTWAAGAERKPGEDQSYTYSGADVKLSFSSEGRLADLDPNGYATGEVSALSLAEQPDDLLDLLSPAF